MVLRYRPRYTSVEFRPKLELTNCWKTYLIQIYAALAQKKTLLLIVNIKGLLREQKVPRYAKCTYDHQKSRGCTLR